MSLFLVTTSFVENFQEFFNKLVVSLQISWLMHAFILIMLFSPGVILFLYKIFHLREPVEPKTTNPMIFQIGYLTSLLGLLMFGLTAINKLITGNLHYEWMQNDSLAHLIILGVILISVGHTIQVFAFEKQRNVKKGFSPFYLSLIIWITCTIGIFIAV